MTELELFHERILNWARCYRYRRQREKSPTLTVCTRLRMYGPGRLKKEAEEPREPPLPVDEADAALLESVYASDILPPTDKRVLRKTYCTIGVPFSFDDTKRQRAVFNRVARSLGLFPSSYAIVLKSVEYRFMRAVESREIALDKKNQGPDNAN